MVVAGLWHCLSVNDMKAIRFAEQNAIAGMDQGAVYTPLPIMFTEVNGQPSMKTIWRLEPEEMKLVSIGHYIIVEILGYQHPPIRLGISERKISDDEG